MRLFPTVYIATTRGVVTIGLLVVRLMEGRFLGVIQITLAMKEH